MREIKFRAWDLDKNEMILDIKPNIFATKGNLNCPEWFEVERFEIMQYTGLHDRNGKEIYEGDHLWATGNLDDNLQYVGMVEWDQIDARWEVSSPHGRFEYIPNGCEVKGNRYEDSLLEGQG
jgi:YopX protein.